MSEFINTIDALGDDVVVDSIIDRTITEFNDDTLEIIGAFAFHNCSSLTSIDLPEVTTVENCSFNSCSTLQYVNLPKLTTINGSWNFSGCKSLKEISVPLLNKVGMESFSGTGIVTICLPSMVSLTVQGFRGTHSLETIDLPVCTALQSMAFYQSSAIKTVILRADTVCALHSTNAFTSTPIESGNGYIYVPAALIEDYKVATNWSTLADQFRALEDYTVDGTTTGELDETKI